MKIKSLNIKNFKSIVDITIEEPGNFSVFVGPNASGKSNIFEALEIVDFIQNDESFEEVFNIYGEYRDLLNKKKTKDDAIYFGLVGIIDEKKVSFRTEITNDSARRFPTIDISQAKDYKASYTNKAFTLFSSLFDNFQTMFIGKSSKSHQQYKAGRVLDYSASNLALVLKRLLSNGKEDELIELISLFVPGFENIEVSQDSLSGEVGILVYDKNYEKPFSKELISDGTYNILALITAVLQTDEPQFLLIEEPENGLNPKAIKELVHFFREQCEEKGHYIWLASHSQTLVSELKPQELILTDKIHGETKIKQFKDIDLHGMKLDEAWLSNVLGGGLPW